MNLTEIGVNIVPKVLLVDRSHHLKIMVQHMMGHNEAGLDLEYCAVSPADVRPILTADQNLLVLINMRAAEDEGIQLCGSIREISRAPILLIGGNIDFQLARKALYHQVSDYLPDPITPEKFIASMKNVKLELDAALITEYRGIPHTESSHHRDALTSASIIDKVKEYVEVALHQNITLKEISDAFHFNYSYLGQKFKYHENMTFKEYLLRRRMEKAKFLLENTEMKVYEIAKEVGYTEMDWFYKKFKTHAGVSANKYRKTIMITV